MRNAHIFGYNALLATPIHSVVMSGKNTGQSILGLLGRGRSGRMEDAFLLSYIFFASPWLLKSQHLLLKFLFGHSWVWFRL